MKRHRKRALTLLIVRGRGRATVRIPLPALSRVLNGVMALTMVAMLVGAGFGLQRAQGPYPHVLTSARATNNNARFSMFQMIMPRNTDATAADILRRASLLHAIKLGLGSSRAASLLHSGIVLPEWQADVEQGPEDDGTLLWPVREGWYVRGYGSGSGGYHLAVDVQGERGLSVLASAPGIVGYAGNKLRGYGNAIMIIHPGNKVTLYAHNERNEVVIGQRVKRGQRIAALGSTGISRGPHVHFEFLHGGKNCDPLPLFRPIVRSHPGHLNEVEQLTWRAHQERPKGVRCDPRRQHPDSRWDDDEEGAPHHHGPAPGEPIASAPPAQ
jgi:murein DD-endopeptidase MepM/ murein hydrolase activator NlpD